MTLDSLAISDGVLQTLPTYLFDQSTDFFIDLLNTETYSLC